MALAWFCGGCAESGPRDGENRQDWKECFEH
jgi:hypothetical protein